MRWSGVPFASLVLALVAAAASDDLQACLELDRAFDTRGLLAPCTAVADDATRPVADRVAALGIVGQAHVINGDDALGERTFLRMLALAPNAVVRADAGARVAAAFARARTRFEAEGAVRRQLLRVERVAADAIEVELELVDPLSRVIGADVVADGSSAPPVALTRSDLGRGVVRFFGRAPAPLHAASGIVRARGGDDTVVLTEPVSFAAASAPAAPPEPDAQAFPIVPAALVGSGVVVAVGAAATAVIIETQLADPKLEADSRGLLQWTGRGALAATALGLVVAAVGAALWAADF